MCVSRHHDHFGSHAGEPYTVSMWPMKPVSMPASAAMSPVTIAHMIRRTCGMGQCSAAVRSESSRIAGFSQSHRDLYSHEFFLPLPSILAAAPTSANDSPR